MASKRPNQDDFDSPWKEALELYFQAFLAFFFPEAHTDVDWRRGYEFLDKELQQVLRKGNVGKRVVDKLIKVWLRNGDEEWLLIHVEVQSQEEIDFARRMFVYNYRVFDRYNRTVISLAVLGDPRDNWRPQAFSYGKWGCQVGIQFPIVKLLDYSKDEAGLEASASPFAVLVLAHLKTQETQHDPAARHYWKTRLVRGLFARGMQANDVRQLYRFIDWLLLLPAELENQFQEEMYAFEEEHKMPFITPTERRGMEKGLEQGLEQGRKETYLRALQMALEAKYGDEGQELYAEAKTIGDAKALDSLLLKVHKGATLAALRRWLTAKLK